MKVYVALVFCALQVSISTSKVLPDYLPQPCSKSQLDYSECTFNFMTKLGPYLLKGVDELNFPKMDPLIVPLLTINRTLEDLVSYYVNFKNLNFWGFNTMQLKSFNFDTLKMKGELGINIEKLRMSTEYEAGGRAIRYPFLMTTAGYSKGNFTNLDVSIKFSLKKVKKQGNKYYEFKDFKATGTLEGGFLKIVSKYSQDQPIVDFIAKFFNRNPKRGVSIVQEDYDETLERYYKRLGQRILNAIPAEELIPE